MSIKYYLTYKGIEGDVYLFEIYEEGFSGEPTEIHGYVNHDYASRKDLVQPTIASSLDISLEADENLTLQDLYTEEESKFKCSLKRNEQTIFYGILKPDGIWEDFVSDRWEISMDAMDGLSILKDLSFVKDDGTFYIGKINQFDAVKQCLKRIGYDLPINISKDLPVYDGFTGTSSILSAVQMNADRFYQDAQKNNIMDCEAVLKSILEPYSATVVQMNGEWWVFRAIDVKNEMEFYRYDLEDVKTDVVWNASMNLGSHIDNFDIHHARANQKKSITASAQAFRVNYKYGLVRSLVSNPNIKANGSLTAEGWSISNPSGVVSSNPSGSGIIITEASGGGYDEIIRTNPSLFVNENDNLKIIYKFKTGGTMFSGHITVMTENHFFKPSENKWALKSEQTAGNDWVEPENVALNSEIEYTLNLPPIVEDSNLVFILKVWGGSGTYTSWDDVFINFIDIIPNTDANYKGEFHTAQRLTRISSVTKADKTVSVGDSLSDIYYGTLYKADGSPTEFWNGSTKPLLQLMVEDALRIAPRPMYFFEGDVFGYFPYLSNILINNVPGKYQVSKYSFDTKSNVNKANFSEFDKVDLVQGTDYRYEFDYDYGSETRVTIAK